jgi:hypothetical protein
MIGTANLDCKTSKRFVSGMLKLADTELTHTTQQEVQPVVMSTKLSKKQAAYEKQVTSLFGACMLGVFWAGRTAYCHGLEPVAPNTETNRPYHCILRLLVTNLRSGHSYDRSVLEITTHSMERMLERCHDTRLLTILKEELTWDFMTNLAQTCVDFFKSDPDSVHKFKVKTTNGLACITFEPNSIPVMTTWFIP